MIELPQRWRVLLVQYLDEYLGELDDTDDTDAITETVSERVEEAATEVAGVDAEDLLAQLEAQLDDSTSLAGALTELIEGDSDFDFTGEAIVGAIEHLCEIEYLEADGDHGAAGFFGGEEYEDDEEQGSAFDMNF
ncbi:MAG: hypothetical protein VX265_12830 [Myxococcota bacterium]|nr:hypothetical protein [Myxococcota bacterium]MEC8422211.1 hypothetical protein [Myxococcota bacterium]